MYNCLYCLSAVLTILPALVDLYAYLAGSNFKVCVWINFNFWINNVFITTLVNIWSSYRSWSPATGFILKGECVEDQQGLSSVTVWAGGHCGSEVTLELVWWMLLDGGLGLLLFEVLVPLLVDVWLACTMLFLRVRGGWAPWTGTGVSSQLADGGFLRCWSKNSFSFSR